MKPNNLYKKLQESTFFMLGPCVIESEELVFEVAEFVKKLQDEYPRYVFIFKSSFDKANRTSISSFRGPGLIKGLEILDTVKNKYQLPVVTDIHEPSQAKHAAEVVDILQIPAFLCRQTDLLVAAAQTGKIVNIKKAQFLSGADMKYPVQKVYDSGNQQILLTERGTMFGYQNLVVDFRNIIDMKELGYPVVFDATHSVQKPGGAGGKSGGDRKYATYLADAAKAVGTNGYFFEIHPNPDKALSDGPNMLKLDDFEKWLKKF